MDHTSQAYQALMQTRAAAKGTTDRRFNAKPERMEGRGGPLRWTPAMDRKLLALACHTPTLRWEDIAKFLGVGTSSAMRRCKVDLGVVRPTGKRSFESVATVAARLGF